MAGLDTTSVSPGRGGLSEELGVFLQFETDGGFFSHLVDDVPLWWFIRPRLFRQLQRQKTGVDLLEKTADSLTLGQRFQKAGSSLGYLLRGGSHLSASPVVALSTASARRHLTSSGQSFDVYFDPLSGIPGLDYAVVEFPDRMAHAKHAFSSKVAYGDEVALAGNAGRMLSGAWSSPAVEAFADSIIEGLRRWSFGLDEASVRSTVRREAAFVRGSRGAARRLLDSLKPSVILVECGYAPTHMVVQLEAKRRSIPVYELQHGLISADDIGYQFRELSQGAMDDSPFPDKVALYGAHFRHILLENPGLDPSRLPIIGNPYLWLQMRERNAPARSGEAVLITSQPGLGRFWAKFAVGLAAAAGRPVIVKPHPREIGDLEATFGPALGQPGVTVVRDGRSIYDLFAAATYHLSAFSTSHLEAIAFGLRDIVIECGGVEGQFAFLEDRGLPHASTVEETVRLMDAYPDVSQTTDYVIREVFATDLDPLKELGKLLEPHL